MAARVLWLQKPHMKSKAKKHHTFLARGVVVCPELAVHGKAVFHKQCTCQAFGHRGFTSYLGQPNAKSTAWVLCISSKKLP